MKKILQVLIMVALFFPLFSNPVPVKAEAEVTLLEKITVVPESVVYLGNGFYTRVCKYKFMVSRNGGDTWNRRATVKIKTKARWLTNYGVKVNWVNTFWWHDYWGGDDYNVVLWGNNHFLFPSFYENYVATYQNARYVLEPGWIFASSVHEDDVGWIYCYSLSPVAA